MKILAFLVLTPSMLASCAGLTPAFGGRTFNEVQLVTTPEGGYTYTNKKKIPAGVEDTSLDEMRASIDAEGNWEISVAGDRATDTIGQAALQQAVTEAQIDSFKAGLDAALNSLAPLIGQIVNAKVKEGEIKAGVANHAIDRLQLKGYNP